VLSSKKTSYKGKLFSWGRVRNISSSTIRSYLLLVPLQQGGENRGVAKRRGTDFISGGNPGEDYGWRSQAESSVFFGSRPD